MSRVAVVDSGTSNLDSIVRALEHEGATVGMVERPSDLRDATHIVIPGVGAFPEAIRNLRSSGVAEEIVDQATGRSIPVLGICLGMQLLATRGGEVAPTDGLGLIPGEVLKLEGSSIERVPHVGWNAVTRRSRATLFEDVDPSADFYFVHSFHFVPEVEGDIAATTDYCGGFVSAVQRGSVFGVQFHPEKSLRNGLGVLRNFLSV
jgi:glutamine amidotransferase